MIYVLRKLIAFVFLGGIFWFIYRDLDNLDKPWFMHALGMIAVAFAFFWLLVPMIVVWFRIRSRRAKNREHYAKWLAEGGIESMSPRPVKKGEGASKGAKVMSIESDDQVFFHEKGTLYTELAAEDIDSSRKAGRPVGRPSDVAFPGMRKKCVVAQRTHCYFTDRRIAFASKDMDFGIPFGELKSFSVMPGGLVFETDGGTSAARFAFTFHNPLVAADVLRFLKEKT
ncbi:MAG: hypothetical protein J5727_01950 [Kiritimatiellae bacterium]|nr:hypothetical protein [Kiritimatiellia bacterium]